MGKAIEGAVALAGAVGMGALAFLDPALVASPLYGKIMIGLALEGLSLEAGAIADALTQNRGEDITTRQPASYRQVIYGTQRVGGVLVYSSTTGSHKDQYNKIIVIATHDVWAITGLYLDGRLVSFDAGSSGHSVRNGYGFGGNADGGTYTGPDGTQYNFGGKVYCEARYGDQSAGDVIGGMTANDPTWAANGSRSPYLGGCCYVYLKIEYDTGLFPSDPEVKFTVMGKPVYDPRSSTTGYSANTALIINDVLTDSTWGLGDATVNQAQLIAAANVCDEYVTCAAGSEARYTSHWHYDTSTGVGDVLQTIMTGCAGRLSRIGGEWYIFPAYFQGQTASFGADDLIDAVQWSSTRSYRDLFNRVNGTYIAANYPYSVAGNLYDSNGWYDGHISNTFPFAFQPTNFPQYACDVLHGYASDQWLTEDGGIQLPKELALSSVLSVSQAQRVAKIYLLRNRFQGTGVLHMAVRAYQLQPCDTFNFSFAQNGWSDKLLEVNSVRFGISDGSAGEAPKLELTVGVNETDPSVYEWSSADELTVYDVPASPASTSRSVAPPTDVALISSAATAVVQPDGTVIPRIEVTWDTPQDAYVTVIQMQYQLVGATAWTDAGTVAVSLNAGYISGVVAGQTYNVQIRSLRASGATSSWVTITSFMAGLVLNVATQDGVGIGTLIGEAYTSGTAAIDCLPFTVLYGSTSVAIFPSGSVMITTDGTIGGSAGSIQQQTLYWVYYVDTVLAGGDVTPIATTNKADYEGKLGYFLIDSIVTPYAASGGGGTATRYYPTTSSDVGSRTTSNSGYAYDGNLSSYATVSGNATALYTPGFGGAPPTTDSTYANGDCIFNGFSAVVDTSALTLSVIAAATSHVTGGAPVGTATITVNINGTTSTVTSFSAATAQGTYSFTIPASTALNTVSVEVDVEPGTPSVSSGVTHGSSTFSVQVTEIYIE